MPVDEKIVSLFEAHTDIIVKDRRDTHFGHKIFLTTGKSGLILDCAIPKGNPADVTWTRRRWVSRMCASRRSASSG